jgi:membrane protein required for colicin V production
VNIIDPILLVLLSLFALRGYFKGFFREAFSLLGLIVGFMVAVRYDEAVATLWADSWNFSFIVLRAITFVALFFVAYFSLNLLGWLLHRSASFLFLQGLNRVGGVLLGMGKGAALLAFVIFFLSSSQLLPRTMRQRMDHSTLAPLFHRLAQGMIQLGRADLLPRKDSQADVREPQSNEKREGRGYF